MSSMSDSDAAFIEYLKTVDTPTLSNAIELLDVRPRSEGFTPYQVRCLFPEFGRTIGYAVTAHVETMTKEVMDRRKFLELYKAVGDSPKPALVVFQEVGPHPNYAAHCGEVMATTFTRLGAVGLISDCAVRDIPEVRAMRFQYFALGAVASHGYFRIVRVGVPVHVHGMLIRPGDLLHGDENGLVVLPAEKRDKLSEAVDNIRSRERALMEFVRGPEFTFDGLRTRLLE